MGGGASKRGGGRRRRWRWRPGLTSRPAVCGVVTHFTNATDGVDVAPNGGHDATIFADAVKCVVDVVDDTFVQL